MMNEIGDAMTLQSKFESSHRIQRYEHVNGIGEMSCSWCPLKVFFNLWYGWNGFRNLQCRR